MLHPFRQLVPLIVWTSFAATGLNDGVVVAQTEPETDSVVATIEPGGLRRYERGKWSTLSLAATNRGEQAASGTLSVFLDQDTRMQQVRHYWVPAGSIRRTWLPIRTPDNIDENQKILHASVLNFVGSGDAALLSRTKGENRMIGESLLALDPTELKTGMITNLPLHGEPVEMSTGPDEVYETVVAVRQSYDGNRTISNLHDRFMAPHAAAYDALDQLVLSNDRIAADSGGISAIRNWIARGGYAWIMLDLVDLETVESLLGNATPYEVVDRVELTEFTIRGPGKESSSTGITETWTAEEPVEFLRVVIDSAEVHSSIDGWPASFSIPFGNGKVFFTTLAARGWRYQPNQFSDPLDGDQPMEGPTRALKNFAGQFNQRVESKTEFGDGVKPILLEQLGYRIPSRSVAALLLGFSCAVIAISGFWFAWREQLDRFAWVIPVSTIIPAMALIGIGVNNTSRIPATSSLIRLANVGGETNEIHTDTIAAFYSPDTVELPLNVGLSGVATPDLQDLTGVAKRAVWDDDGHGRWEQVTVASGSVRLVHATESRVLDLPLRAQATFGPNGLEGRLVGVEQLGVPEDAIIASPAAPRSDVRIQPSGTFRAGPNDLLSNGEFITDTMLSTGQQQHQAIYREVLAETADSEYPPRTTLFVWGKWNHPGLMVPDLFQPTEETLFAIPVEIGRTAPGQPFVVPATFVRVSNAAKQSGRSLVFDPATGNWLENMNSESQTFLQFTIPREVRPCRIKTATITLKIHAPSRTFEMIGIRNGEPEAIETRKSPSGVYTFFVEDPELLELNENGDLQFGINVSKTDAQIGLEKEQLDAARTSARKGNSQPPGPRRELREVSSWQIDYLQLHASGETN